LNDAERYFSIYVDVLSYNVFGGTIADNHKKLSPDNIFLSFSFLFLLA